MRSIVYEIIMDVKAHPQQSGSLSVESHFVVRDVSVINFLVHVMPFSSRDGRAAVAAD